MAGSKPKGPIEVVETNHAETLGGLLVPPAEALRMRSHGSTVAAVLIPLFLDEGELTAVFTKRHADMRRHAGEISFPGGRRDTGEDLRQTALREAEEEIGLTREAVELVGALPPTSTFVTSYSVYPFVGLIEPSMEYVLSPHEVEEVVEIRLSDLVAGYERKRLIKMGVPVKTDAYTVGDLFIWGATARIVSQLIERLEPLIPQQPVVDPQTSVIGKTENSAAGETAQSESPGEAEPSAEAGAPADDQVESEAAAG